MKFFRYAALAAAAMLLAGCQLDEFASNGKHLRPLSYAAQGRLQKLGMKIEAPIMLRIYKQEAELEIWKKGASGRFELFKTYEICRWSGKFGPKLKEGDRQAPEGFYLVTPALMNPNSKYYLSFNLGFPNSFDRSRGRTGTYLMVHGACSSAGCYSMTDDQMQEIYSMARDAFRGGQEAFQVQAFPFRMTADNFFRNRNNRNLEFWTMLKQGSDHFEVAKYPPKLDVCDRRYVFNAVADDANDKFEATRQCPAYSVAPHVARGVAKLEARHKADIAALLRKSQDKRLREAKWEARGEKVAKLFEFGDKDAAGEPAEAASVPAAAPADQGADLEAEAAPQSGSESLLRRSASTLSRWTQLVPGLGGGKTEPPPPAAADPPTVAETEPQ